MYVFISKQIYVYVYVCAANMHNVRGSGTNFRDLAPLQACIIHLTGQPDVHEHDATDLGAAGSDLKSRVESCEEGGGAFTHLSEVYTLHRAE